MSNQDSELKVNKEDSNYLGKKKQSGGLFLGFVFVLMLSAILGLALWVNQISMTNKDIIIVYEDRISLLEEQLSIVDSVNADSMTGVSAQLQFLDKEIRKLWDLSNKRNKVDIQKSMKDIDNLTSQLNSINNLIKNMDMSVIKNESKLNELLSQLNNLSSLAQSLFDLQKDIKSIKTEILIMDESTQALNNYRKQNNATIIQLQNEIRLLRNTINLLQDTPATMPSE
jgi:DNA repair exonuclease SbcCD ATPase subunit